jgi:hypothetical protein
MHPQRRGERAVGDHILCAPRVDLRHQRAEASPLAFGERAQRLPELRFKGDTGAMAGE